MVVSLLSSGKEMQPIEINSSIYALGIDQTTIAKAVGCSPSLVSKVINRKATSTKVAKNIAIIIGLPFLLVFPEYQRLEVRNKYSKKEKIMLIKKLLAE